jgi:hypothetical protein
MYTIGFVPDTHAEVADFMQLNPKVLPENVALAWKFFGAYTNNISVRTGTLQNEQLQILASNEATGEKEKYYLTEEDQANTTAFMKELMRYMLDEVYDKRFGQANLPPSGLEAATWTQQRAEAQAYSQDPNASVPMLTMLATARNITVGEMANKVLTAIANYNNTVAELIARKQSRIEIIKACNSIADCNRVFHRYFDMCMPLKQMQDEDISGEPTAYNL